MNQNNNLKKKPDVGDLTIATISPFRPAGPAAFSGRDADNVEQEIIKIRLADSSERVNSAGVLVQRKYFSRGLEVGKFRKSPGQITLMAFNGKDVVGTLTLGLDEPNGLLADELYKSEIDSLRATGRKVCEFTKLAVDQPPASKPVLAALFHVAYAYARILQGCTDVVFEVNPRQALSYKRMLGFEELGPVRMCTRVKSPAVLLRLETDYVDQQIELWGGKKEEARDEQSLFPYFFSKEDEAGITHLLNGE